MEIPWATIGTPSAGQEPLIMGSRFELTSAWRSPAFLAQAMRIWMQARRSPGILGVSLRAYPLRGTFWTLSAWTDEAALRAFAGADPHRSIVRRVRPWAKTATFRFWSAPAGKLGPGQLWAEAEARITAPAG